MRHSARRIRVRSDPGRFDEASAWIETGGDSLTFSESHLLSAQLGSCEPPSNPRKPTNLQQSTKSSTRRGKCRLRTPRAINSTSRQGMSRHCQKLVRARIQSPSTTRPPQDPHKPHTPGIESPNTQGKNNPPHRGERETSDDCEEVKKSTRPVEWLWTARQTFSANLTLCPTRAKLLRLSASLSSTSLKIPTADKESPSTPAPPVGPRPAPGERESSGPAPGRPRTCKLD